MARIVTDRLRVMLYMMCCLPGGLLVGGYDPGPAVQVGHLRDYELVETPSGTLSR
jgi:hypothetical protein